MWKTNLKSKTEPKTMTIRTNFSKIKQFTSSPHQLYHTKELILKRDRLTNKQTRFRIRSLIMGYKCVRINLIIQAKTLPADQRASLLSPFFTVSEAKKSTFP